MKIFLQFLLLFFTLRLPGQTHQVKISIEALEREFKRQKKKRLKIKKKSQARFFERDRPSAHRGYLSTAARDVRYSDQQKLRRMFRNS